MKFLSCFSGIEAASVAFKPLGWQCVGVAEIEKFPCAVLAHHYPDVPNLGDVLADDFIDKAKALAADILIGGPPCQDFSVAGLRKGIDGHRGNLSLRWVEIINAIRPAYSITENVPGWLSVNKGHAFGAFLAGLVGHDAALIPPKSCGGRWTDSGMVDGPEGRAAWRILDAQYFGLAQRRRRVFVVFCPRGGSDPAKILFEPEGVRRDTPPRREAGKDVAPTLDVRAGRSGENTFNTSGGLVADIAPTLSSRTKGGGGLGTVFDCDGGLVPQKWPADIAPTLDAHYGDKMGLENQHINAGGGCLSVARCLTGSNQRIDAETETLIPCRGGSFDGVAPTLTANGDAHTGFRDEKGLVVAHTLRSEGFDASEDGTGRQNLVPIAYTLHGADKTVSTATETDLAGSIRTKPPGSIENSSTTAVLQRSAVRRLIPEECETLQGFPCVYTKINDKTADGPRYKALGNSFAVNVVTWIGQRIDRVGNV